MQEMKQEEYFARICKYSVNIISGFAMEENVHTDPYN